MNKMQLIKITLLIVILAEEIKKVKKQKIKVKLDFNESRTTSFIDAYQKTKESIKSSHFKIDHLLNKENS